MTGIRDFIRREPGIRTGTGDGPLTDFRYQDSGETPATLHRRIWTGTELSILAGRPRRQLRLHAPSRVTESSLGPVNKVNMA